MNTISEFWTNSDGSSHLAPISRRPSALEAVLLKTLREYPLLMRCLHMWNPITPVPIHPIFGSLSIKWNIITSTINHQKSMAISYWCRSMQLYGMTTCTTRNISDRFYRYRHKGFRYRQSPMSIQFFTLLRICWIAPKFKLISFLPIFAFPFSSTWESDCFWFLIFNFLTPSPCSCLGDRLLSWGLVLRKRWKLYFYIWNSSWTFFPPFCIN